MDLIPRPICVDIVRRVGHHGFRELSPIIAAGSLGRELAFDAEVLREVDIDEFIFSSHFCNEDSAYRPFLKKCLEAGNPTAQYVEGLRLAVLTGPSQVAINLLGHAAIHIKKARFACGVFLLLSGNYDGGLSAVRSFIDMAGQLADAVPLADTVLMQILDMGIPRGGRYDISFVFPPPLPYCYLSDARLLQSCQRCFAYRYCRIIQDLC